MLANREGEICKLKDSIATLIDTQDMLNLFGCL